MVWNKLRIALANTTINEALEMVSEESSRLVPCRTVQAILAQTLGPYRDLRAPPLCWHKLTSLLRAYRSFCIVS